MGLERVWRGGGMRTPPQTVLQLWGRGLGEVRKYKAPPPVIAPKNGNFFEFAVDRMRL